MNEYRTQIVVLGAGYAGMMAALRLGGRTRRRNVTITLVSQSDAFMQRPRMHQVATDRPVPAAPIRWMLRGTNIDFVQGQVSGLDPDQHLVTVMKPAGEDVIAYDYLVYALGSVVNRWTVPGAAEYAYSLDPAGPRSAQELRLKLPELAAAGGRVVVVGSGPTGIEGATEIKGRYPGLQVSLLTEGLFETFKGQERIARHLRQAFGQQGITVLEQKRVVAVEDGSLCLADSETIPFDLCVWAGGFRPLPLAARAKLAVNGLGQVLVDPFERSVSHPEIYAVGDAAQPVEEPGTPVRMSLQAAITQGAHAADNLGALLNGRPQQPLSFAYYGQGIALGPKDAIAFVTYPDDKARGPVLRGRVWLAGRDFFVWLFFALLGVERRWPGFYQWLGKGRYAAAQRRKDLRRAVEIPARPGC